jgi:hypothetical protein
MTDHSPLQVSVFEDLAVAADWLGGPIDCLEME